MHAKDQRDPKSALQERGGGVIRTTLFFTQNGELSASVFQQKSVSTHSKQSYLAIDNASLVI